MLRRSFSRFCDVRKIVETSVRNITNDVLRPLDHFKVFVPPQVYATPMVLCIGNHSAGKSTLINSLLNMEEQQTGVAPVDDGFTIIMRASTHRRQDGSGKDTTTTVIHENDVTEDGPTAVASERYGLQELKSLGSVFVNRLRVKTRRLPPDAQLPENMMLVDSPGMIDAPSGYTANNITDPELLKIPEEVRHRGFDFLKAVSFFAQRADVILLMFDPNNPGTTSETLSVLTHSLRGQEHKFLILFNKVDVFDKVNDFARAYATLCWNLSKVIPLKDIPKIYTTFTPTGRDTSKAAVPMDELNWTRNAVRDEILRAPSRRMDNLLTETEEAAHRLLLCGTVCNALKKAQKVHYWNRMGVIAVATVLAPVAVVGLFVTVHEVMPVMAFAAVSATTIAYLWRTAAVRAQEAERQAVKNMDSIVHELYPGKMLTEELRQRWTTAVKPVLEECCNTPGAKGIEGLPSFGSRELKRVEDVLQNALPGLRKQVDIFKRTGPSLKL